MKKNLLKSLLVVVALTMGMNAWADEVEATLTHTASSYCGSDANVYTSDIDGQKEHVNNAAFNATWQGAAYADFSFTLPEGSSISKALLTFRVVGESRRERPCDLQYANAGEQLDYDSLGTGTAKYNLPATTIKSITFPKGSEETMTVDVTTAVSTIAEAGQSNIIFKWTGNPGGGDVYGKNSTYAPTLVITAMNASSMTSYTVKFTDGTNELKDAKVYSNVVIGETAQAKEEDLADFTVEDNKYIYVSGNDPITLVADAAQNVITLKFRKAENWSYTITTSGNGDPLGYKKTGSVFENSKVWVDFPRYQGDEFGQYVFEKKPANNDMGQEFTINQNNFTADVAYTLVEGVEHVFWGEGEILFEKVADSPYCSNRMSGGSAGYVTDDNGWFTSLEPGTYQIRAGVTGEVSFTFSAGAQTILTASSSGNFVTETTNEFTLEEEEDIIVEAGGDAGSSTKIPKAIDYILITKAADITNGIQTVATQQQPAAMFNLAGQRVQQAQKGLYIQGGKKFVVK
jgi:hypothetical protein